MKNIALKLALGFSLIFCTSGLFAAKNNVWIDIGARAAGNLNWLVNSNIIKDRYMDYDYSFGFSLGGRAGINFSDEFGIGVEGLLSRHTETWVSDGLTVNWKKQIQLTSIDIPVLFKYTTDYSFVELGPTFSLLQSASQSFASSPSSAFDYSKVDIKNSLNMTNIGAALGFGSIIWANGGLSVATGLRFNYYFTDLIGDSGGKGKDYLPKDPGYPATETPKSYTSTNLLTAGFMISIDYDLGYLVSASCKRQRKFLFF